MWLNLRINFIDQQKVNKILTENSEIQLRSTILGPEFESFVKDLLEAPDISEALEDIADQYNLNKIILYFEFKIKDFFFLK